MAVQVVDAVSISDGKAVASYVMRALEHDAPSLALYCVDACKLEFKLVSIWLHRAFVRYLVCQLGKCGCMCKVQV